VIHLVPRQRKYDVGKRPERAAQNDHQQTKKKGFQCCASNGGSMEKDGVQDKRFFGLT